LTLGAWRPGPFLWRVACKIVNDVAYADECPCQESDEADGEEDPVPAADQRGLAAAKLVPEGHGVDDGWGHQGQGGRASRTHQRDEQVQLRNGRS